MSLRSPEGVASTPGRAKPRDATSEAGEANRRTDMPRSARCCVWRADSPAAPFGAPLGGPAGPPRRVIAARARRRRHDGTLRDHYIPDQLATVLMCSQAAAGGELWWNEGEVPTCAFDDSVGLIGTALVWLQDLTAKRAELLAA